MNRNITGQDWKYLSFVQKSLLSDYRECVADMLMLDDMGYNAQNNDGYHAVAKESHIIADKIVATGISYGRLKYMRQDMEVSIRWNIACEAK